MSASKGMLPDGSLLALEPMSQAEGSTLLDLWRKDAHRSLQQNQRHEVLDRFAVEGLPLYLKLVFEEARRWTSSDEQTILSTDIPGIIRDLFARLALEANHGEVLVSRSLSYLAAARNGLSEDELLDVFSRDRQVMANFRQRR